MNQPSPGHCLRVQETLIVFRGPVGEGKGFGETILRNSFPGHTQATPRHVAAAAPVLCLIFCNYGWSAPSSTLAAAWFFVMSRAATVSAWRAVAASSWTEYSKGWSRCLTRSVCLRSSRRGPLCVPRGVGRDGQRAFQ